jgi:hypothetical protein
MDFFYISQTQYVYSPLDNFSTLLMFLCCLCQTYVVPLEVYDPLVDIFASSIFHILHPVSYIFFHPLFMIDAVQSQLQQLGIL